jgi:hypothetical protein
VSAGVFSALAHLVPHRYILFRKNAGLKKIEKSGATPSPEIWETKFGWNVSLMDSWI